MIGKIFINGIIGIDVTVQSVMDQLHDTRNDTSLEVHISSEGGMMYDGFGIYDLITGAGKPITTIAHGLVASMGSVLFMTGEIRRMSPNARLMIHNAQGGTYGEVKDLVAYAEEMKALEAQSKKLYQDKTGLSDNELTLLLDAETWLGADDAVTLGFATEVAPAVINKSNKVIALASSEAKQFDMNILNKIKEAVAGSPKALALNLENGETLTIVTNDADPAEGNPVNFDGKGVADGVYNTVSGLVINVASGIISTIEQKEIVQPDANEARVEAMETEIENLKKDNKDLNEGVTMLLEEFKKVAQGQVSKGFVNTTTTPEPNGTKVVIAPKAQYQTIAQRMEEISKKNRK